MISPKRKNKTRRLQDLADEYPIEEKLSFAASEAYKLLRTNLMFSFPDDARGRAIGITSALRCEGKSLTAINVAHSLAEAEKKVLLLEADLRIPSMARHLNLSCTPGLSNLLVGTHDIAKTVQQHKTLNNLSIMVAGDIPPNPSELLGASIMQDTMGNLVKFYDYIIVDLPPVTAVSDPLVISKCLDGMVVVVRNEYAERSALAETIRQLQFVGTRILGFVFNCTRDIGGNYQRGRKNYDRYYKGYGEKHYYSGKRGLENTID